MGFSYEALVEILDYYKYILEIYEALVEFFYECRRNFLVNIVVQQENVEIFLENRTNVLENRTNVLEHQVIEHQPDPFSENFF